MVLDCSTHILQVLLLMLSIHSRIFLPMETTGKPGVRVIYCDVFQESENARNEAANQRDILAPISTNHTSPVLHLMHVCTNVHEPSWTSLTSSKGLKSTLCRLMQHRRILLQIMDSLLRNRSRKKDRLNEIWIWMYLVERPGTGDQLMTRVMPPRRNPSIWIVFLGISSHSSRSWQNISYQLQLSSHSLHLATPTFRNHSCGKSLMRLAIQSFWYCFVLVAASSSSSSSSSAWHVRLSLFEKSRDR